MATIQEINNRVTITNAIRELHHDFLAAARKLITRDVVCATCNKPMLDEFYYGEFDGVLNDAGHPFHHGCEDF